MTPFDAARMDISERIAGSLDLLQVVLASRKRMPIQRAKGFAFVEMFAVYEPSVRLSVQLYLAAVRDANVPVSRLQPGLQALLRNQEILGIAASKRKSWEWRTRMLSELQSGMSGDSRTDAFPDDGSYYRRSQLDLIWKLLQLPGRPVPDGRIYPLVGEIVEHRNAIAHGREKPESIGRGISSKDAKKKLKQTGNLCTHILSASETGSSAAIAAASL